nr:MAG TPA_asm: Protein of unknown function (DUF739) [Caudoviricetes sp.]
MKFNYERLSKKIKEKYRAQDAFAKVIGITRTSLSYKLNGKSSWHADEMYKVCKALDIPLKEIPRYFFEPKGSVAEAQSARMRELSRGEAAAAALTMLLGYTRDINQRRRLEYGDSGDAVLAFNEEALEEALRCVELVNDSECY